MGLDRFRGHKASPDYTYMSLAMVLILFGLVMLASSSVVLSNELYNGNYGFVNRQSIALAIGLVSASVVSAIHYKRWQDIAPKLLLINFILLFIVFLPGIGKSAKGAARWIDLGPFQLQPSELLKLTFILYFAAWIEKRGKLLQTFEGGLFPFILLLVPIVLVLIAQRDLGTLLVIVGTGAIMFFVAGATFKQIFAGLLVGIAALALLVLIEPYRLQRFTTFLNPASDKLGSGYHVNQLHIAVGSGGFLGRGFNHSMQKYLYLPEPHTDSIFAIIVEELGFVRSLLVMFAIGLFAYRGYQIALRATDGFGRMVAFGITSSLFIQAIINIAAVLGLVPLTGIPLPFISYGGTALILSLISVGVMVNISKYSYGK